MVACEGLREPKPEFLKKNNMHILEKKFVQKKYKIVLLKIICNIDKIDFKGGG